MRARVLEHSRRELVGSLVDIGDEQHGLSGQRREQRQRIGCVVGRRNGPGRAARLERVDHLLEPPCLGHRVAVAALRRSADALEPALGLLEVGVDQLGLDRLDVGQRVDTALGMDHVRILVRADDMDDRVGLADVREELVAETLALVRAGDEAGDVVKRDRVGHDLRGPHDLRDRVEARVHDGHDCHIRLDRRERVVRGFRGGSRQRREQRGLAGVRHPDDPDLHRVSASPTAVPNSAPASTSLG